MYYLKKAELRIKFFKSLFNCLDGSNRKGLILVRRYVLWCLQYDLYFITNKTQPLKALNLYLSAELRLKVHISTGVKTNIVADVVVTGEHSADSPQFKKLVQRTAEQFTVKNVMADAAYSSRLNHEIVDRIGGRAYIAFKSNATGTAEGSKIWRNAFLYFQIKREEFLEYYHKRSNAETTFSAIKNKFGETIKSKNKTAQINEMLCKVIAYNITIRIHSMYELGITPNFCV